MHPVYAFNMILIYIYYNIVIEHEDVTINDRVILINKLTIIKI